MATSSAEAGTARNTPGAERVETDAVRIREIIQSQTGEWVPPISALGGPPAHLLYHELVLRAGLKLYRDDDGQPLAAFLDGEGRRTFCCPSPEFTGALDRFRMRRGLRPSPAKDIDDLVRVIHARVTDPDARVPVRPVNEPEPIRAVTVPAEAAPAVEPAASGAKPALPGDPWTPATLPGLSLSFSGGFMRAGKREPPLPHHIRVLQSLIRHGGWMGSAEELSSRLGEDENRLTQMLVRYRADLAEFGIVVANVQVESGWKILVVDRARLDDRS